MSRSSHFHLPSKIYEEKLRGEAPSTVWENVTKDFVYTQCGLSKEQFIKGIQNINNGKVHYVTRKPTCEACIFANMKIELSDEWTV